MKKELKLSDIIEVNLVIDKLNDGLSNGKGTADLEFLMNIASLKERIKLDVIDFYKQQEIILNKFTKPDMNAELSEEDKKRGMQSFKILNQEKFNFYMNKLLNTKTTLFNLPLITKEQISSVKGVNISVAEASRFLPFTVNYENTEDGEQKRTPIELNFEEDN